MRDSLSYSERAARHRGRSELQLKHARLVINIPVPYRIRAAVFTKKQRRKQETRSLVRPSRRHSLGDTTNGSVHFPAFSSLFSLIFLVLLGEMITPSVPLSHLLNKRLSEKKKCVAGEEETFLRYIFM